MPASIAIILVVTITLEWLPLQFPTPPSPLNMVLLCTLFFSIGNIYDMIYSTFSPRAATTSTVTLALHPFPLSFSQVVGFEQVHRVHAMVEHSFEEIGVSPLLPALRGTVDLRHAEPAGWQLVCVVPGITTSFSPSGSQNRWRGL